MIQASKLSGCWPGKGDVEMEAKVTNVRTMLKTNRRGVPESILIVESTTKPVRPRLHADSPRSFTLDLPGLSLNMPADTLRVYDGLLREMEVRSANGGVTVSVSLDHPTRTRLQFKGDLPVRTVVRWDRSPVRDLMTGRRILIHPAHGGRDKGARGPINLLEKDIVLDIARRLERILARENAEAALTRADDHADPWSGDRLPEHPDRVDCIVSLHTGHDPDRRLRGIRTQYHPGDPGSRDLAAAVHEAVRTKLLLPNRGLGRLPATACKGLRIPLVRVEMVCIRNPLEEALLRSIPFRERLAQGIFNGLKDTFAIRLKGIPANAG